MKEDTIIKSQIEQSRIFNKVQNVTRVNSKNCQTKLDIENSRYASQHYINPDPIFIIHHLTNTAINQSTTSLIFCLYSNHVTRHIHIQC